MRWSLKKALTLNFVLLASLPILIVGFVAIRYLSTAMEKEISQKNLLLAESYASELDRFLDDALRQMEHMVSLLEDGSIIYPEKLNEYLASQISGRGDLEMLRILDPGGRVTHLAPFDRNIHGLDMSRQAYTVAAKNRRSAHWSDVFISPQTGASTLVLTLPFERGMVVGHLSLSAVNEMIASITNVPGRYITVLDGNGTTVAHYDRSLVAQRFNLSSQDHIAQGLLGNEGNFRYDVNGKAWIGSIARVTRTNWVVAVSQPLNEVFMPVRNLRRILFSGMLLAAFIAAAVAVLSLQKILLPLKRLTHNAQKIESGNYQFDTFASSYSEIEELRRHFKTMTEEVNTREASLRESEFRFRSTFEQAAVGIAHVSPEGHFLRVNQKFCDILRYSHDDMMAMTFGDITPPGGISTQTEQIQRMLKGETDTFSQETRYMAGDAKEVWVHLTLALVRDESAHPRWFVAVVNDISDRMQAQTDLKHMRDYTDHLIETANVMIVSLDTEGKVTHFNPAAAAITGYTLHEITGRSWFELLVPRNRYPEVYDEFARLTQGGLPQLFENPILTKDGRERFISWSNSEIRQDGHIIGLTSFGIDITERRQAEASLRESEERFRTLVEQSPLSVQIFNPEGQLVQVNAAWMKLWGITGEMLPEVIHKYNVLEDNEAKETGILLYIKKAFSGEGVILPVIEYDASNTLEDINVESAQGFKRFVQARFYPIKNNRDEVINVVSMEEDISDRKQAEQEILQYQLRLKALASQLTLAEENERRAIAADLHDHVGHSLALARIQLKEILESTSKFERNILVSDISNILLQALQETRSLIFELSSPSMNEIGLEAAISEWLEEQIEKRHGLKTEFSDTTGSEHRKTLDENVRAFIFRNVRELLTNVVKHARASKVAVHLKEHDNQMKIVVEDDGIGFDLATLQTKTALKYGFGLFSIQERMSDLGGAFDIESTPGNGCRVVLTVPERKIDKIRP